MRAACVALLLACHATLGHAGIVGDQLPAQYPMVNVHVPEPAFSALDAQIAAEASADENALLTDLASRLDAKQARIESATRSLRSKAEQIAEIIEPMVVGGSSLSAGKREASPLSMLSTKAMPVDAYKIRNSLYLTQPMRGPAQASVNVLVHEDIGRMGEAAKYKGMKSQIARLRASFARSVAELPASALPEDPAFTGTQ